MSPLSLSLARMPFELAIYSHALWTCHIFSFKKEKHVLHEKEDLWGMSTVPLVSPASDLLCCSSLITVTNTPFKPDEFQRVHPLKFFGLKGICRRTPGEHRWNTDELLSKTYPPRPLLVNREFIGVQRWFAGKKSPVWKASRWTSMKMPMKFWVLCAAEMYTSCWAVGLLTTSFAVEWFSSVFIGVWSERVE